MDNFIDGFGIGGYRSFGPDTQIIGPFKKINFFVGQNNSGKSNILQFIKTKYPEYIKGLGNGPRPNLEQLDKHLENGRSIEGTGFAICLPSSGERLEKTLEVFGKDAERIRTVLKSPILRDGDAAWLRLHSVNQNDPFKIEEQLIVSIANETVLSVTQWQGMWSRLTNLSSGDLKVHWIPQSLMKIFQRGVEVPKVNLVQAIRRIGDVGSALVDEDFSGYGIIERLAAIQNPAHDEQHKRKQFENINDFLRVVLGNPSARLEIPYQRNNINVEMDGKILPLTSLGTGIHEVIILAAAATVLTNQVLCIEEPELHLHPLLQKKLVRYLQLKTSNQYFFTTHSAHLLDTPDAAIFHIRLQNGSTTVERAENAVEKSRICADLGYRASDLLQSNCAIWVEGPSDRIYLNHWIRSIDNELIEGIHYSIMFYGGRLLSHLSAEDPEITEFISLRRLNRYIAIVIDSDRNKAHSKLNATKSRVRKEFDQGPGFAWITQGREIENYVPEAMIARAVKSAHAKADRLKSYGRFEHVLYYRVGRKTVTKNIDKIKIAHAVSNEEADLSILDLNQQVNRLVEFIRRANDN